MRDDLVHSSGVHGIHTYGALRDKDIAAQFDVVSENVHTAVGLIFISFPHNEDLVMSLLLADGLRPLCAETGWSCW